MKLESISRGMIVVSETTGLIVEVIDVDYAADRVLCEAPIDGKTSRVHFPSDRLLPSLFSRQDVGRRAMDGVIIQGDAGAMLKEACLKHGFEDIAHASKGQMEALLADLRRTSPEALLNNSMGVVRSLAAKVGITAEPLKTHIVPGSLVRLKSGGPAMTVNEMTEPGVVCYWFDGGKLCVGHFFLTSLDIESR
jgi:uncharacterized protein YodC (DUF2158 family)